MKILSGSSNRPNAITKVLLLIALSLGGFSAVSTVAANASESASSDAASSPVVFEDGVYLFGQSPTPDQIGTTYAIFSVENSHAVGAFYQPHSSFDCFSGQLTAQNLDVTVVDSYTQTAHSHSIAMTLENSLVAGSAVGAYTLDGFYPIEAISDQDASMLSICQGQ